MVKKINNSTDFSLVLACYNEETHLEESISEIIKVLDLSNLKYEIILVDDNSPDGTRNIIKKIVKKYPDNNIRYIFHEKNTGRGGAVTSGIKAAQSEIAGYIDVDLEVSPVYIPYCVQKVREGWDVVLGRRIYKVQLSGAFRYLTHWVYLHLVKHFIGVKFLNDTETGYKFFEKKKILPVLDECKDTHWFWSTELVANAFFKGLKFYQVPALYLRNTDKKTTVKVLRDSWLYFKSLIKFSRKHKKIIKERKKAVQQANRT